MIAWFRIIEREIATFNWSSFLTARMLSLETAPSGQLRCERLKYFSASLLQQPQKRFSPFTPLSLFANLQQWVVDFLFYESTSMVHIAVCGQKHYSAENWPCFSNHILRQGSQHPLHHSQMLQVVMCLKKCFPLAEEASRHISEI